MHFAERILRITAIDDDAGDVELLRRRLQQITGLDFELLHAGGAASGERIVAAESPDLVFVDYDLGSQSGLRVVESLRACGSSIAIVMLTGQGSEAVASQCLRRGADDYITKDDGPDTLRRAIDHALAQRARREAEHELQFVQYSVDRASDAVYWVREDGRVAHVNETACRLLGYTRDELLAMSLCDFAPDETEPAWKERWQKIQRDGVQKYEQVHRRMDRSTLPVEVHAGYVRFQDNQCVCLFVRDVSDRKQAEQALREKEAQLRHKQRLEAVGSLAGGAAHEFNNLLQVMRGYVEFAMQELPPDGQAYEDLSRAKDAARKAATITRQLLNFSRLETPQRTNVDLNEVVRSQCEILRPLLGEQITIELELHPRAIASVDGDLLEQALTNLCLNARDAMPKGGTLRLSTRTVKIGDAQHPDEGTPDLSPGHYVVLSVADTGAGIPHDIQPRVFDPFFTTKGVGKGTGMGLAVVYGIVQEHGGAVQLTSEPGAGTEFRIYLSRVNDEPDVPSNDAQTPPTASAGPLILIAEDEPLVREVAVRTLRKAGYPILTAANGEEAVECFRRNADRIGLVILDVIMPRLGGHDAFLQMQSIQPEIKALFCSGYDPETANSDVFLREGWPLLQKPFEPDQLRQMVEETLAREPLVHSALAHGDD